jgi:hypothetical protein
LGIFNLNISCKICQKRKVVYLGQKPSVKKYEIFFHDVNPNSPLNCENMQMWQHCCVGARGSTLD